MEDLYLIGIIRPESHIHPHPDQVLPGFPEDIAERQATGFVDQALLCEHERVVQLLPGRPAQRLVILSEDLQRRPLVQGRMRLVVVQFLDPDIQIVLDLSGTCRLLQLDLGNKCV